MKYKLTESGVKDTETGMFIPEAPGNRHWQEYQSWLAEGNTPEPQYTEAEYLDMKSNEVRATRDRLLTESDKFTLPDFPHNFTNLLAYRQDLREIPNQSGFPLDVVWPELQEGA